MTDLSYLFDKKYSLKLSKSKMRAKKETNLLVVKVTFLRVKKMHKNFFVDSSVSGSVKSANRTPLCSFY